MSGMIDGMDTRFAPVVLCAAGFDSSCGAGITADMDMLCAMGLRSRAALSAVVAENEREVRRTDLLPIASFEAQLRLAFEDKEKPSAIKSGMLGTAAHAQALAKILQEQANFCGKIPPFVLDPVLAAHCQGPLSPDPEGLARTMRRELTPFAALLTPNIPEAAVLLGARPQNRIVATEEELRALAKKTADLCACPILLKGGHVEGEDIVRDILIFGKAERTFISKRVFGLEKAHGGGCRLATAIAGRLALGDALEEAVAAGRKLHQRIAKTLVNSTD